jgi:hypothetical protein
MSAKKIIIKAGNPAVFDPNPLNAQPNYNVFWSNSDPTNAHWPAPSVAEKTAWFDYQIPPGAQSNQLALPPMSPPAAYTLNYVCALHPNEKGQIKVNLGGKKKGAFAKKTKKGAFAKKTKLSAFAKKTKKSAFGDKTK